MAFYLLLLGSDITESVETGFDMFSAYCGYHSYSFTSTLTSANQKYYYAVVEMPTYHPACIPIAIQQVSQFQPRLMVQCRLLFMKWQKL
jgi:hypothetical protein